uniref:Flagellin n=1 Tax=Magnetococcus massalia (strain MO-1) TaxID=451514 RepID=I3V6X6_MAGMO|nr:flagellin protein FliC14 [Candidatus Magnetococcus massalia]CRH08199.1 Putative flagellin [Candidatus Magnetococcus massalia]
MAITIQSTLSSTNSNAIDPSQRRLNETMERIATGVRIAQASDNAAMLGLATSLSTEVRSYNMARQNANDGIAMAQVGQTDLQSVQDDLQRLRELAAQAGNGILTDDDRANIQLEAAEIKEQIAQTIEGSQFNENSILNSTGSISLQTGIDEGETTDIQLRDLNGLAAGVDLSTQAGAQAALSEIDSALNTTSDYAAYLGSQANGLEGVADRVSQIAINSEAARSRVQDANMAVEMASQASETVRLQSYMAVRAQAQQMAASTITQLLS